MLLLTKKIREKLLDNDQRHGHDHIPVLKLFDPSGAATWLFTELQPDGDTLFGLCDLGFGLPEIGYASLNEITKIRGPFGLPIERDLYFETSKPLSIWASHAREAGRIEEPPPRKSASPSAKAA